MDSTKAQCPISLTGSVSTCAGTGTYFINNFNSANAQFYTWTVMNRDGSINQTFPGSQALNFPIITSTIYSDAFTITVNYNGPGGNCTASIITYSCCDYGTSNALNLTNATSANIPGSSTGIISNREFRIYGTLTINNALTFTDCVFNMGEGSEIVINNSLGAFNSCTFTSCLRMWKGIRIINNGTFKSAGSLFSGAQYAVQFTDNSNGSNGFSDISNQTIFRKNYISVFVPNNNNGASHILNLIGLNEFEVDGSLELPLPYLGMTPASNGQPFCGIDVSNVTSFPIGNSNNVRGVIHDIPTGIIARNSNLEIKNTDFFTSSNSLRDIAISVIGTNSSPNAIGQTAPIEIMNNTFNNYAQGIRMQNCRGTITNRILITNNEFNTGSNMPSFVGNTRTAINVSNPINVNSNISISNNKIDNSINAIICLNIASAPINNSTYNAIVGYNTITFNQPESTFNTGLVKTGITITNGTGLYVQNNNISRSFILNANQVTQPALTLFGINVSGTGGARIKNNYLSRLGTCVQFTGGCIGTQNFCNTLNASYRGFHMNGSLLSDQGTDYKPQDNTWNNFVNVNRISGTTNGGFPIWYYRNNTNYVPIPFLASAAYPIQSNNPGDICGVLSPNLAIDSTIENIKDNTIDYLNYQLENEQITASQLYELLGRDQAIFIDHPDLAAYYLSLSTQNEGLFVEYGNAVTLGELERAHTILTQIMPENAMQSDLKITLEIADKIFRQECEVISEQDSIILAAIAYQSVFQGGLAVLNARAMLGIVREDIVNTQRISSFDNLSGIHYQKIGDTYFFFNAENEPVQRIEVYNYLGQSIESIKGCKYVNSNFPSTNIIKVINQNDVKVFKGL
jgi:hypothetical protein